MKTDKSVYFYAIYLGVTAITLQIVLTREFFAVFYGNELCFGILLAIWMLWVALGSRVGASLARYKLFQHAHIFPLLQTASLLAGIGAVIAIKFVRIILSIPMAEFISFAELLGFALLILALPCILVGMQFAHLAGINRARSINHDTGSLIYINEALGSAVGGIFVSLAALNFFSNSRVLLLWGGLSAATFIFHKVKWSFIPALLFLLLFLLPQTQAIEFALHQQYWRSFNKDMQLIDRRQSRFGELAVIEWGGEKSLYGNSVKQTLLPDPIGAQELAALVLVQHPQPRNILLIGGGLGGAATELARNKNTQVIYVELDRDAYKLALAQYDSVQQAGFRQGNLQIEFNDGRLFLDLDIAYINYDMIIVNIGKPTSAVGNRYYTDEFLRLARSRLEPGGVLAICGFPSAENYFGQELLQLNAGLYTLLHKHFADALVLPGDNAYYFAAVDTLTLTRNPDIMSTRFANQGLQYDYFYPQIYRQYYLPERLSSLEKTLTHVDVRRLNSDFAPVSYYYDFVLWYKLVRGHTGFFSKLALIDYQYILFSSVLLPGIFLTLLFVFKKAKRILGAGIILLTLFFGFSSSTVNIILLFAFQVIFGYIYEWIGVLMGIFMAGMALGAYLVYKMVKSERSIFLLNGLILSLLLLLFLLVPILTIFQAIRAVSILFAFLVFFSGAITGGGFPLLLTIYNRLTGRLSAGILYAADLSGGAIGSCLVSGFFIPLYGFSGTLFCLTGCGIVLFIYWFIAVKAFYKLVI